MGGSRDFSLQPFHWWTKMRWWWWDLLTNSHTSPIQPNHPHTHNLVKFSPSIYRGFPTRMVYPHYISRLRYTILVGNPRYHLASKLWNDSGGYRCNRRALFGLHICSCISCNSKLVNTQKWKWKFILSAKSIFKQSLDILGWWLCLMSLLVHHKGRNNFTEAIQDGNLTLSGGL